MPRAAGIIIDAGRVALIERRRADTLYYVFPGGTIEPGETPEQATVREVAEEIGLDVVIDRLVVRLTIADDSEWFFVCRVVGGQFGSGYGDEMSGQVPADAGFYRPVWMPLESLAFYQVYPEAVAEHVRLGRWHDWPVRRRR